MAQFIRPPHIVDSSILRRVDQCFDKYVESVGKDEHIYVLKRIDRTLTSLFKSVSEWEVKLATSALTIYKIYSMFNLFSINCCQTLHDPSSDFCLDCGGNKETLNYYTECIKKEIFWQKNTNSCTQTRHYTSKIALASLYYLCNPFNIIPDQEVGIGFVDDAHVINKCVKFFKKGCPEIFDYAKSK